MFLPNSYFFYSEHYITAPSLGVLC